MQIKDTKKDFVNELNNNIIGHGRYTIEYIENGYVAEYEDGFVIIARYPVWDRMAYWTIFNNNDDDPIMGYGYSVRSCIKQWIERSSTRIMLDYSDVIRYGKIA